jgi:hypothetical protein
MKSLACLISLSFALTLSSHAQESLQAPLEQSYRTWRDAMQRKDIVTWKQVTAPHRQMEIKNRILSEKRAFPAAVFDLPAAPPKLDGMKFLEATRNGATAKAAYFGKIDFGVDAKSADNLLVISFVQGKGGWLYDRADVVNLASLPEVRKELAAGNLKYLKETPEARPSGIVPSTPIEAQPAKTIAKVYVFCPGREVKLQVNRISHHRFANVQEAEVVIGGALDGLNDIQFTTRRLEGSTGKEALSIRVYLMSQVTGVKPIKVFEYQAKEGELVKGSGSGRFEVTPATQAVLTGKNR